MELKWYLILLGVAYLIVMYLIFKDSKPDPEDDDINNNGFI